MLRNVAQRAAQDNINCMIAGEKRFIFMHPSYKQDFEAIDGNYCNIYYIRILQ